MWVADSGRTTKSYAFNIPPPPSTDATLSALTVSPENIIGFASDRTSYEVGVASTVTEATIAARRPTYIGRRTPPVIHPAGLQRRDLPATKWPSPPARTP